MPMRGANGGSRADLPQRIDRSSETAPEQAYARSNYTTQINVDRTNIYRLPDGTWKDIRFMTEAEMAAAHIPAP